MTATATTAAPAAIDERVSLTFARRERGIHHWIEGEYPEQARPEALFAAFEAAGWTLDAMQETVPAYEPYDYDYSKPLVGQRAVPRGHKVREFGLTKPGTSTFGGWSAEEKQANMREARAILRRFGFTRVPVWTKTLADML
jgi:hypothetical protein